MRALKTFFFVLAFTLMQSQFAAADRKCSGYFWWWGCSYSGSSGSSSSSSGSSTKPATSASSETENEEEIVTTGPTSEAGKQSAGETAAASSSAANSAAGGVVGQIMSASGSNGGSSSSGGGKTSGSTSLTAYVERMKDNPGIGAITETIDEEEQLAALERGVWIKALGGLSQKNATGSAPSSEAIFGGAMAGVDIYSDSFYRLGLIGATARVNVDVNANDSHVQMTLAKVGVTNSLQLGSIFIDHLLLYGPEFTHAKRSIEVNDAKSYMTSDYVNHRITNAFEIGHRSVVHGIVLQPSAGVQLDWMHQPSNKEKGLADAALYTKSSNYWAGNTKVGMTLSTAILLGDHSLVPSFGAYWIHRFGKLSGTSMMSFDSGNTYQAMGDAPIRDLTKLQAGLLFNMNSNLSLSANYAVSFTSVERNHAANLGLRYRF
ncbi:autotransporter outer membrane beta-barrel domain-containing protein [uncultured Cohaesibacter sp.]|uniref:autotransporter outer membrane beta-barrel domain-containing protein n=1 Tax=uncultured Cohaesibacter sp. TaxID=1002546 RepID=UPI00292E6551|nr:autotransporter outer membrane beta-barrel domain-containing protein [uncultured Cohaesibacter sp.]